MTTTFDHGGAIFSIARQMGLSAADILDFSASINPLGISPLVRQAIIKALDDLVHYPDTTCCRLKQALAQAHGVDAGRIVVANGSTEIIYSLPGLLPGKRATIIAPAFSEYRLALAQQGWQVSHFLLSPRDSFALNTTRLYTALQQGCDLLYLCNPANPSGTLYPAETVARVYELCAATGTFLVLDEAFMDFCEEASAKEVILSGNHGLVLRSMTKFHAIPGLRLGYALTSAELADRLSRQGAPWSVNTLAQAAGLAALADHEHAHQSRLYVEQQRRSLMERLQQLPGLRVYPSHANYLLVELLAGPTSTQLQQQLLSKGLLIRDCVSFTGLSDRFFRIAVRRADENLRLVTALHELLA